MVLIVVGTCVANDLPFNNWNNGSKEQGVTNQWMGTGPVGLGGSECNNPREVERGRYE